jgi:sugar-phosphatase
VFDPSTTFDAVLFDMDGTLVDSIAAANHVWTEWATRHGVDPDEVLRSMHGVRAIDTVRRFAPVAIDAAAEAALITEAEIDAIEGVVAISGAAALLDALPPGRWAIVTSAPRPLASARIAAAGLPLPSVLISAEDVDHGKPAPDCYLAAAAALGFDIERCLVFEDAPAGIAAAETAGAAVVVVTATHPDSNSSEMPSVVDYRQLHVVVTEHGALRIVGDDVPPTVTP